MTKQYIQTKFPKDLKGGETLNDLFTEVKVNKIKVKLNPNKVIVSKIADIGAGGKEYNIRYNVSKVGDPNFNYTVKFLSDVHKKLDEANSSSYYNDNLCEVSHG
tara:strand:+ start:46 stop:357 length:312 start_codon:yes stop_codon:yes gene_type:complete